MIPYFQGLLVRKNSLKNIKKIIPDLKIYEVASGTQVFDWIVPNEWEVKEAWIKKPNGEKICDFSRLTESAH